MKNQLKNNLIDVAKFVMKFLDDNGIPQKYNIEDIVFDFPHIFQIYDGVVKPLKFKYVTQHIEWIDYILETNEYINHIRNDINIIKNHKMNRFKTKYIINFEIKNENDLKVLIIAMLQTEQLSGGTIFDDIEYFLNENVDEKTSFTFFE